MTSSSTTVSDDIARQRAYVALAFGVTAVSLAAIFIRLAQGDGIPSIVIAAGRLVVAALILTPIAIRNTTYRNQISKLTYAELTLVCISGLFLALHFWSWVTSLEHTSVLISVVLVTTTPIWVALLEIFFLKASLSRLIIVGLVVTLAGSLIIGLGGEATPNTTGNDALGGLLSAIGAITVGVYLIIGRKLRPKLALIPYIWMVYGFAATLLSLVVALGRTPVTDYPFEGYMWIIATALMPQLIGHSSFNYALAYLPATFISVATQVEPIGSAIIAAIVFQEIPGWAQVTGSAVILVGVTLASLGQTQLSTKRKRSSS